MTCRSSPNFTPRESSNAADSESDAAAAAAACRLLLDEPVARRYLTHRPVSDSAAYFFSGLLHFRVAF